MPRRLTTLVVALASLALACTPATPPPQRELIHLRGSPYDRGLQHGQQLKSKIRSFYTTLLASSLLPYLNREQAGISSFLTEYRKDRYQGGRFSYELLLDSAKQMQRSIPTEYQQEMQGIADGSGMSFEQVLVLNTFVDATLAVRGVALALALSGAPHLDSVEFVGGASDEADNDGDGKIDEMDEGLLSPFTPLPVASAVELPEGTAVRFVLSDPDGVDPSTVRVTLNADVFVQGAPELKIAPLADNDAKLEVTFTPPSPLALAAVQSVSITAGDKNVVAEPAPAHAHFMREERITFTTRGLGKKGFEVPNRGVDDGRSRPPSIAFAVKGAATPDGMPRLAQHFTLLDGNTSHNHTAVFVHHPDKGAPFVVVGWAGIVWGFSGMNSDGLAQVCQPSDTLDNSVVANLIASLSDLSTAKLVASGTPIGFALRQVLQHAKTTEDAVVQQQAMKFAYGWSCLVADANGSLRALETDANADNNASGVYDFGPDTADAASVDETGRLFGSLGPDDLRISSHYLKNRADMFSLAVAGQRVVPQSQWSSFYFRSLRAHAALGDALTASMGHIDTAAAEEILSRKELVDTSDSMNAVVFEPATRLVHSAMGTVPATDSPFETLDLKAVGN